MPKIKLTLRRKIDVSKTWFSKFLSLITLILQLKNQRSGSKIVYGISIILSFERTYDVSNSKSPCICFKKKFNKNEAKSKMENHTHSFKETNLVLQIKQE